jgi:hypothetical protein
VPEKRGSGRVVKKLEICFGSYSEFIETYTENIGMGASLYALKILQRSVIRSIFSSIFPGQITLYSVKVRLSG